MRVFAIVLIIAGILMIVFTGINFKTEKKVADIGPLEVNKTETRHVGWPTYAGGVILLAGVVLVFAGKKK